MSAFADGDVISAKVQQALANGVRLAIGRTLLDVATEVALKPGTTVTLQVNRSESGVTLRVVPPATGGTQPAERAAGNPPPRDPASNEQVPRAPLPRAPAPDAQAARPQAIADAAARQSGTPAGTASPPATPASAGQPRPATEPTAAQTPRQAPAGAVAADGARASQGETIRQPGPGTGAAAAGDKGGAGVARGSPAQTPVRAAPAPAPPAAAMPSAPNPGGNPGGATAAQAILAGPGGGAGATQGASPSAGQIASATSAAALAQPQQGTGEANAAASSGRSPATSPAQPGTARAGSAQTGTTQASVAGSATGDAVAITRAQSVAVQGGLGPLFAHLAAVLADPTRPRLDRPADAAARHLLGLRLPADALSDPQRLQAGVKASGTFLEAALGKGQAAQGDLKSALLALANALRDAGEDGATQVPARAPLPQAGKNETAPQPPERHAAPQPQRPSAPALPLTAGADDVLRQLAADTQGALARVRLLQIASLPDTNGGPRPDPASDAQPRVWQTEVPVAIGRETSVLGLRIEEERRKRSDGGQEPVWRVRFAVDLPQAGAISAAITYTAPRISVALWAEREETSQALAAEASALRDVLQAADLDVEALDIQTGIGPAGARAQKPGAPGRLVDREG
ncbi:MAG: flagellar hook-length control protein FliK [Rhodobiaceae bacterium]|nr:flagellar hook-length control protein FliK [Rhodobiaceae bacterium]